MMLVSCTRSPPNCAAMLPHALIVATTASLGAGAPEAELPALDVELGDPLPPPPHADTLSITAATAAAATTPPLTARRPATAISLSKMKTIVIVDGNVAGAS